MNLLLGIALTLLVPISVLADLTVEKELSDQWDSLRFALGILESDAYSEGPVLVLYKTAEGGVLMTYDSPKTTSRPLNKAEMASIVARLRIFFAGAGSPPPPGTKFEPPEIHMKLSIDHGLNRHSFFKRINPQKEPAIAAEVFKYIEELSKAK